MESVISLDSEDQILKDIQTCTNAIRQVLAQLLPRSPENAVNVASPQQMSDLLAGLMRAGQCLRALPLQRGRDLEEEICAYRIEVNRLHSFLPAIQASLLAERARLEHDRERLNGAAAWAEASSQTAK